MSNADEANGTAGPDDDESQGGASGTSGVSGQADHNTLNDNGSDYASVFTPRNSLMRESLINVAGTDNNSPHGINNATSSEGLEDSDLSTKIPTEGAFKDVVDSCYKDAFLKMMTNRKDVHLKTKFRNRINSLPPDPEEEVTKKRKKEMSPQKETNKKVKTTIGASLETFNDMLQALYTQVMEQTTVKKETKQQMKLVIEKFADFKREYDNETSTRDWREMTKSDREIVEFRKKLLSANTIEDINVVLSERWPQGGFKKTKVNARGKLYDNDSTLYSILLYPENSSSDKNLKALQEKIPAVRAITDENIRQLGYINVCQEEATDIPGVKESSRKKTEIIIAGANMSDKNVQLHTADVVNWADTLKKQAIKSGKEKIAVTFPSDDLLDNIRKIFECRFADSMIAVQLIPNEGKKTSTRRPPDDAIMVNGGTYAEILKTMKEGITPEDIGIKVKKIQETSSGSLRMVITETTTGAREHMMKKMKELLPQNAKVTASSDFKKGIIVMDIENDISIEEVKERFCTEFKIDRDAIIANEFRASYGGSKMLSVKLPSNAADSAIRNRWIKLGWTNCRIKEKLEPSFCSRCQNYGHTSRTCRAQKAINRRCLKCGEQDHIAKDCKKDEHCFTCGEKHWANSMRCASYSALVKKMRSTRNDH